MGANARMEEALSSAVIESPRKTTNKLTLYNKTH